MGERVCTSGVAEGLKVEGQLLHTLSGLLIVLRVLWTGDQGDRLGLRNLRSQSKTLEHEVVRCLVRQVLLHCLIAMLHR